MIMGAPMAVRLRPSATNQNFLTMELKIQLRFVYLAHRKAIYLADYLSGIESGGSPLNLNDFDKTSYAYRVLNEEFEAAMIRANEKLLANGFGEEVFQNPRTKIDADEDITEANCP